MSQDRDQLETEIDRDLPPISNGADPWCTWCDEDLPDTVWLLHERDDGRWPPAFCCEEHAYAWGNAEDDGEGYTVDRSDVCAFEP